MANEITLQELGNSFKITREQLFDVNWIRLDIGELDLYYLGNRLVLINDGQMIPEYFEVILDTPVQRSRLRLLDCLNEITTTRTAVFTWARKGISTKPAPKLCTFGAGALETFLATIDQNPYALIHFHIKCRQQEQWVHYNPLATLVDKPTGFFQRIAKAVSTTKSKIVSKVF